MIPLSLAFCSYLLIASIVSWAEKKVWNSTSMWPEAASTNRHPPPYDLFLSESLTFFFRLLIPLPSNFLPRVGQTKWSTKTRCPGCSFSADRIPSHSLTTVVRLPGFARLVCFPNMHDAHLGRLWLRIFATRLCRRLIAWVVASAPDRSSSWMSCRFRCPNL